MATRTKPLVSAAVLASAAAIAVASPAIGPSLTLPSPHALSAAKVQLANFSDVVSVLTTPAVISDLLFQNTSWGGVLSATNYGGEFAKPATYFGQTAYKNPWAVFCSTNCTQTGLTGAFYLLSDALVNGNGKGYADSANWSTGVVNYLFEPNATIPIGEAGGSGAYLSFRSEGVSAATWYLAQQAISTLPAALSDPLTVALAAAYTGPHNVTVFYNLALNTLAAALQTGSPLVSNMISAYLGNLPIPGTSNPTLFYQSGLSGPLNYGIDLVTGAAPKPTAAQAAAATPAAPAVAAATLTAAEAPAVSDAKSAVDAPQSTPAVEVKAPVSTPAADTKAPESTPAAEVKAAVSTPAAEVKAAVSTPAVDTKELESTPAAAEIEPADVPEIVVPEAVAADNTPAPAKAAPKHPVHDALEKVGKQITSAINNAKAAKAAKAGSADSAS